MGALKRLVKTALHRERAEGSLPVRGWRRRLVGHRMRPATGEGGLHRQPASVGRERPPLYQEHETDEIPDAAVGACSNILASSRLKATWARTAADRDAGPGFLDRATEGGQDV